MPPLLRALHAESLKLKRTLALRLTVVAPFVITGMVLLFSYKVIESGREIGGGGMNPWDAMAQQSLVLWAVLMMPLFITLETALLAGLEHQEKTWKLLYTQPVPRWTIYAAKQLTGMTLIAISMLALWALILLDGLILRKLLPNSGFDAPIPWLRLLQFCGLIYLSSWLILSIHTWVALRWHSFVVAMSAGIAGTVAATLVIYSAEWNRFYPWTAPLMVANGYGKGEVLTPVILFSVIGGVVFALLGAWEVGRREVG